MIWLENLTKVYRLKGRRTLVADNINAVFPTGASVALLGRNGAGKSTLLQIIAGEMSYDSGDIFKAKETKIGYLKQNSGLISERSIWEEMRSVFAHLDEADVRRAQGGAQQALQHRQVARKHAILRCRGELVGDELAGVVELLAQVLQARIGEVAGQQQGQQQRGAEADGEHAVLDVPALARSHRASPAAGRFWR